MKETEQTVQRLVALGVRSSGKRETRAYRMRFYRDKSSRAALESFYYQELFRLEEKRAEEERRERPYRQIPPPRPALPRGRLVDERGHLYRSEYRSENVRGGRRRDDKSALGHAGGDRATTSDTLEGQQVQSPQWPELGLEPERGAGFEVDKESWMVCDSVSSLGSEDSELGEESKGAVGSKRGGGRKRKDVGRV